MTPAEQIEAMTRVAAQADQLAARLVAAGSSSLSDAVRPSLPIGSPPAAPVPVEPRASTPRASSPVETVRSTYDPTVPQHVPRPDAATTQDLSGATPGGGWQDSPTALPPPPSSPTEPRRADEDPSRLPFALETTTQARLTEIRDALSTVSRVGGGTGVVGQNLGDGRSDWERDVAKWRQSTQQSNEQDSATRERMLYEAAPLGGSSRNLFDYGMRMRGIGSRLRSRLSRARRTPETPPDPKDYTASGRRKSSLDSTEAGATGFQSMADVINITAATVNLTGQTAPSSSTGPSTGGGVPSIPTGGKAAAASGEAVAAGEAGAAVAGAEAGAAAGPVGMAAGAAIGHVQEDPVGAALSSYPMVSTLLTFTTAVIDASKATYEFARAQEDEVRRLSEYGAGQAIGTANLDTGRVLRDIDTAEQTGESSQGLTESIDKFEAALQPIESLMTDVANTVGGRLLDLVTLIVEPVGELFKVFKTFYDGLPAWLKSGTSAPDYETSISGLSAVAAETARINDPRWPR